MSSYCVNLSIAVNQDEPIDYKKLLMKESMNSQKDRITVNFPTIVKANSAVHKNSPFTYCDKEMVAFIKSSPATATEVKDYSEKTL